MIWPFCAESAVKPQPTNLTEFSSRYLRNRANYAFADFKH